MNLIDEVKEIISSAMSIHVGAMKEVLLVGVPFSPTEWSTDE